MLTLLHCKIIHRAKFTIDNDVCEGEYLLMGVLQRVTRLGR